MGNAKSKSSGASCREKQASASGAKTASVNSTVTLTSTITVNSTGSANSAGSVNSPAAPSRESQARTSGVLRQAHEAEKAFENLRFSPLAVRINATKKTTSAKQDSTQHKINNILPDDATLCILRCMSERPRSRYWMMHVNAKHLISLLGSDTELAAAARRIFTKLAAFQDHVTKAERELQVPVSTKGNRCAYRDLLGQLAPRLEHLVFHGRRYEKGPLPPCPQLRSLRVVEEDYGFTLRRLLRACKGGLRELAVSGEHLRKASAHAIAMYGADLQVLSLEYVSACNLDAVWDVVGPTLTTLRLGLNKHKEDSRRINDKLPNVTSLQALDLHNGFLAFLIAIGVGSRLREFRALSPVSVFDNLVGSVAVSCPNAKFDVCIVGAMELAVGAIGDRLRAVHVDIDTEEQEAAQGTLVRAAQSADIEEISLTLWAWNASVFFDMERPKMRKLVLEHLFEAADVLTPFMNKVGKSCRFLEELSVEIEVDVEAECFTKFGALALRLEKVYIGMNFVEANAAVDSMFVLSFVQDLSVCQTVKEINIGCDTFLGVKSTEIADGVLGLRARGIGIVVGDIIYNS